MQWNSNKSNALLTNQDQKSLEDAFKGQESRIKKMELMFEETIHNPSDGAVEVIGLSFPNQAKWCAWFLEKMTERYIWGDKPRGSLYSAIVDSFTLLALSQKPPKLVKE